VKIKIYVIDLEIPPRVKRWGLRIGIPAVVLGVGAVAFASNPNFTTGEVLQASDLQTMSNAITALQASVTAGRFVVTINGAQYSVGATTYVGVTTTGGPNANGTYNGYQVGGSGSGYVGAKAICQTLSGPTAHMCSADELLRSAQAGVPIATGWYSSATRSTYTNSGQTWDCSGWDDQAGMDYGATWSGATPDFAPCNSFSAVLCCD
jgi:hypothetical protein